MNAHAMARLVSSLPRDLPKVLSHGGAAIMANVNFCLDIMNRMDLGPEHRPFE